MYKKINNEEELNNFLNYVDYFHDGVIYSINYISGSIGDEEGIFPFDTKREVILKIQGCSCEDIFLKFGKIAKCVIIPTSDEVTSEIHQSNIQLVNGNFIYVQDADDIKSKIKITKYNRTSVISKELFYEIIPD